MKKLISNENHTYTNVEIDELRKCKDDIVYFCKKYVYIQHPIRGKIKFDPYDYQIDILHDCVNHKLNITLQTRQAGVSLVVSIYILWYSIFNHDKISLIATPKLAQARDLLNRIRFAFEELPIWLRPNPCYGEWNKNTMGFDNKSRIMVSPIDHNIGRSYSISMLFVDGMAWATKTKQEDFWTAVMPSMSIGSTCYITSGLNVEGDTFIKLWESALDDPIRTFNPRFVDWDAVPGRDADFKRLTIERIGEAAWRHEYECSMILGDEG